jgi:hypothetical protein
MRGGHCWKNELHMKNTAMTELTNADPHWGGFDLKRTMQPSGLGLLCDPRGVAST